MFVALNRLRTIFSKILCLFLIFQVSGCGFTKEIIRSLKGETFTYTSGEIFNEKINPSKTKIMVRVVDVSCIGEKLKDDFKEKLIKKLQGAGYKVVKSTNEADLILNLVFKNFTTVSGSTLNNIKKYMHYKDTIGVDFHGNGEGYNNFAISDSNISVGKNGSANLRSAGFLSKLVKVDFASGFALGALGAYLITGANPIGLVLGAFVGGVITSVLQIIAESDNYSATILLRISQKTELSHEKKRKFNSMEASNVTQEAYIEEENKWLDYNSDILVTVESAFSAKKAKRSIANKSLESVSSILIG